MENPSPASNQNELLAWISECLEISKRKTSALIKNDLAALELCLEQETLLLSRRGMLRRGTQTIPRSALSTLRAVNKTNRALIANGLDLSRTLMDTIHPPATYSATPWKPSARCPVEPFISVKC